jgi:cell wall-associated NlpC family hydrolase
MTAAATAHTAADIIAAARRYIGSPLRHQGRFRALDCVGLVLAVADDLGLVDVHGKPIKRADYANYPAQPVDDEVQREIAARLEVVATGRDLPSHPADIAELLRVADAVTLRVPLIPCHAGIVSTVAGKPGLIHAYSTARKVIEHRFDAAWLRRIAGVFRFPGILSA